MPNFGLNIPVLVQQEGNTFSVRPLFFPFPQVYHHRFEKALDAFKTKLGEAFRSFALNRDNLEVLLWYHFTPSYEYKQHSFQFHIKNVKVEGSFSTVHFELDEKVFISFPGFDDYMAMVSPAKRGGTGLRDEAERIISRLLLREYQDDPEEFDPSDYMAPKREFVTEVTREISFKDSLFKFELENEGMAFRFMRSSHHFEGEAELLKVGYPLSSHYPEKLRRAWFREELVEELHRAVFEGTNTPIVLVGPEGVGRHSVVEETLFRHIRDLPEKQRMQKIWYMDPTRVISGMSYVGMWEKRLESILRFLISSGYKYRNDKVLIDNPVALTHIGRSGSNDLAMGQVLKPYLEKREVQLLLIATPEEWKLLQEKDRGLTDLFQVIRIAEPTEEGAFRMAMEQRRSLENLNSCQFTIQAIIQLFSTYRNFYRNKALPGIIIKWMQQFAVKHQGQLIDSPEVLAEFGGISGFKELFLDNNLTFQDDEVESRIGRSLVGQEKAVKALSDSIHLIKARLRTPGKPLASYLFIGPTGVGKTQAAKVLAEFLMGHTDQIIRFDMNEYIDPDAPIRLVGDYFRPEGQMVSKVRYQPFGILLLDEIEKAHYSVHDLLLQVLDDGRLTDGRGRAVDFSNTIIIMTSNLGAREVSSKLGFRQDEQDEAAIYTKEVRRFFRPEFINRIDRIVVFNPLKLNHILDIAQLQIQELLQREGFLRRTTMVNIDPRALDWVAKRGFDGKMGGRALKRQIEKDLTSLTAEQLVNSKADQPVLFDIFLEAEKLVPHITPLHFADRLPEGWIPELPSESKAKPFYEKLVLRVEKLEQSIRSLAADQEPEDGAAVFSSGKGPHDLDWSLFQAKEQAGELNNRLKMILLQFQEDAIHQPPVITFRLKTPNDSRDWHDELPRHQIEDLFLQKQALEDLYARYQHETSRFDSASAEFFQDYLGVAFLALTNLALKKKRLDRGVFRIHPYQTGKGMEQVKLMLQWYEALLKSMQISCKTDLRKNQIEAEGYGIAELFKAEEGVHLFFVRHETPLPLMTYWLPANKKEPKFALQQQIIRLYDENRTITDLRSGFTNDFQITPEEMKVFLFAGLNPALRERIIPK